MKGDWFRSLMKRAGSEDVASSHRTRLRVSSSAPLLKNERTLPKKSLLIFVPKTLSTRSKQSRIGLGSVAKAWPSRNPRKFRS